MTNRVFIARCEDYAPDEIQRQVDRIFQEFGGVEALLKRGRRVLIKPNLLIARSPEGATTAHPAVVQAVARVLTAAGAQVTLADSPGGRYTPAALERVYAACGMAEAARASGARLNDDFTSKTVHWGGRELEIITPALEADLVINIAKLKTHMLTYYTGAVKNMFGTVAGTHKAAMHARYPYAEAFCRMLVDLCQGNTPALSIIDGIVGMEGKGPSGGSPRKAGVLVASESPWAADLAAMTLAGLSPQKSPVHRIAVARGLVPARAERLAWAGDSAAPLDPPFAEADPRGGPLLRLSVMTGWLAHLKRWRMAYPIFSDRCVGCGDCAAVCPQKAIVIEGGRAVLDRSLCVKCYCCHEMCPIKAVDTDR